MHMCVCVIVRKKNYSCVYVSHSVQMPLHLGYYATYGCFLSCWACVQFHFISLLILYCHHSRKLAFSAFLFLFSVLVFLMQFIYLLYSTYINLNIILHINFKDEKKRIFFFKILSFFSRTFIDSNALKSCNSFNNNKSSRSRGSNSNPLKIVSDYNGSILRLKMQLQKSLILTTTMLKSAININRIFPLKSDIV